MDRKNPYFINENIITYIFAQYNKHTVKLHLFELNFSPYLTDIYTDWLYALI